MADHPGQRHMTDPIAHQLPGTFHEVARLLGHFPAELRPTEDPGLWRWIDRRRGRPMMRYFRWRDIIDPGAPGYRPGGAHRTWREHRRRLRLGAK